MYTFIDPDSWNWICATLYRWRHLVKAMEVTTGLVESDGSLPPGDLQLTACTPGSAPCQGLVTSMKELLSLKTFYH